MIRRSLKYGKVETARQKKENFLLWWLWANVLQGREALWAASCSWLVWEETSAQQRPVGMTHPVHPRHTAQRFQPAATKHPGREDPMPYEPPACCCFADIWDLCCSWGAYSEDGVMVVKSGPSLTGVAGYSERHIICFTTQLLLQDMTDKHPIVTTGM